MNFKLKRVVLVIIALFGVGAWVIVNPESYETDYVNSGTSVATSEMNSRLSSDQNPSSSQSIGPNDQNPNPNALLATAVLEKLEVKGRAPKTGYARTEFYNNWPTVDGCSLRQRIIKREFGDTVVLDGCNVISGEYTEPYTGVQKTFSKREEISKGVQIDHVVALGDAWQKGAQYLDKETRYNIATDPLNLLAVDAAANEQKSDGDAATWLPSNKAFRCQYVARQVSVKYKYSLWVTEAEKSAISRVLEKCPNEPAIGLDFSSAS